MESSLIDRLLAEQQRGTAVERFAELHARDRLRSERYRDLIPLSAPAGGEQYAFEVDLDACTGCHACVSACHHLNGLGEDESWRRVGQLFGSDTSGAWRHQYVTSSCHHCVDPACMTGCPVGAYEKDASTGVVYHLDDQCFGCQYCTLMCPYEVPEYRPSLGIVRKCDMCRGRLAASEAPACVEACPNGAIRIRNVRVADAAVRAAADRFVPGAARPSLTVPTTIYRTGRELAEFRAGDDGSPEPAHDHPSLVTLLVGTQLALGAIGAALLVSNFVAPALRAIALGAALVGNIAATMHLGRPALAWKAWLGWRSSWLSRECIALGVFTAAIGAALLARTPGVDIALFGIGALAIASSAMVYVATKREAWSAARVFPAFASTTALCGTSTAVACESIGSIALAPGWLAAVPLLAAAVIAIDCADAGSRRRSRSAELRRSALLLDGVLGIQRRTRIALLVVFGVAMPAAAALQPALARSALLVFSAGGIVAGEWLGRSLYFRAAIAPGMPRGPR